MSIVVCRPLHIEMKKKTKKKKKITKLRHSATRPEQKLPFVIDVASVALLLVWKFCAYILRSNLITCI